MKGKFICALFCIYALFTACSQNAPVDTADTPGTNEKYSGTIDGVQVSKITLDKTFNPNTRDYSGACSYSTQSVEITITLTDPDATAGIGSILAYSGQSVRYPLVVGDNVLVISDKNTDYTYKIKRKTVAEEMNTPCPNYPLPNESDLEINSGTLSKELIVEEGALKDYHPYLTGTKADSWDYDIKLDEDKLEHFISDPFIVNYGYNVVTLPIVGDLCKDSNPVTLLPGTSMCPGGYLLPLPLIKDGQRIPYAGFTVHTHTQLFEGMGFKDEYSLYSRLYSDFSESTPYMLENKTIPVYDTPRLQRVRYWKCISSANINSGSHTFSETRTVGVTKTNMELFLKAELDASLDLSELSFTNLSAKLMEVTVEGTISSVSMTKETSYTFQQQASAIEGATTTTAALWQLVEEFRIVDSDGKLFDDPFYRINNEKNPVRIMDEKKDYVISTTATY